MLLTTWGLGRDKKAGTTVVKNVDVTLEPRDINLVLNNESPVLTLVDRNFNIIYDPAPAVVIGESSTVITVQPRKTIS